MEGQYEMKVRRLDEFTDCQIKNISQKVMTYIEYKINAKITGFILPHISSIFPQHDTMPTHHPDLPLKVHLNYRLDCS